MRFARARLLLASVAFAAWVGWLGYQALSRGRDYPVLSRSQLLVSTLDVIADVKDGAEALADPVVTVREVHWPAGGNELVGRTITVGNLASSSGFRGAGEYILPLTRDAKTGEYQVAGLPRSPGFASSWHLIYPVTPDTRRQLDAIPKPAE